MQNIPAILALLGTDSSIHDAHAFVVELLNKGYTKERVLDILEAARKQVVETGEGRKEDQLVEVMDLVVGWCSPHLRVDNLER